jgi:hypothetical protein
MYDSSDLRSQLVTAKTVEKPQIQDYADAQMIEFHNVPPAEEGRLHKTWYARGQNFIVSYTEAEAGAVLDRHQQVDEYMAFLPHENTTVDIFTDGGEATGVAHQLAIIPPGDSKIVVTAGGFIIRLFTTASDDLVAECQNKAAYVCRHPNIPDFAAWPQPVGGFKLRLYPVVPPDEPGRFGRLYRSTNLMVNLSPARKEPKDPRKLSPHSHDDFEQGSLTLSGDYIHHLRWPWTPDSSIWKEDAHLHCSSPSMTIMPASVIHTSQSLPGSPGQLVDIFSPPRFDFSERPGWVLNAADYPMP